jgi:3-oxoacyl-[acyl-carrier protein] reductase
MESLPSLGHVQTRATTRERLANKIALVTGAGSGIGRGTAKVLADNSASLLLVDIDERAVRNVAKEIEKNGGVASYLRADVTKRTDMEKMAEFASDHFGRIDILCQNTGIYPLARLENLTEELWDKVFAVNLKGAYLAVRACVPYMKKQNYGKIIIISSITGPITGVAGLSHYGATKAGLIGFVRSVAIEVAKYNITVNAVQPGNILTEGLKRAIAAQGLDEEYFKAQARTIPIGRLGEPEDVGYAVLFLASDESKYITGQSIVVDGGQVLPESGYSM